MAKRQAKTQSAQTAPAYQLLSVQDLSGGMDLRSTPTLLPTDRSQLLLNWSLAEPGALVVRPGYAAFSTVSLGSQRSQGAARIYLNTAVPSAASTIVTVVGFDGALYLQTDSGGWNSTSAGVLTGLSSANQFSFPADRDLVGVLDGATTPKKSTDGTVWTRLGIAPGTSSAVVSTGLGGSFTSGTYEITYTYKDRDLGTESNASTALSTGVLSATISTGSLSVVVANSTDAQVDAIVIYARKTSAGETVARRASSQVQSTTANSTIVLTSTGWTTNDEAPTDHTVPPLLSFGVVWKNRWWARHATITNRLHFTQLFQPQSWPGLFYIDMPFDRGDTIQALVPLGDYLMVFGNTRIFVVAGQTSLDFEVRPTIASQDGAFGPRAVAVLENGVVHAGASGVWLFDGTSDKLLSFDIEPAWRDLLANTAPATLAKIPMVYHEARKELRIAVPRLFPRGTEGEWVLDLNRTRGGNPAWTATDRTIGGYVSWDGPETVTGNRGRLFSWHSSAARLFEESVGTTANSSNLTAEYTGPGLTLGSFRARWIDLRGDYEPHAGSFGIEAVVDGIAFGSQSVNIGVSGWTYGEAEYGTATYGGNARRQFYLTLPLESEGMSFYLKAIYVGQEAFKWFTYHVGLKPEVVSRSFSE